MIHHLETKEQRDIVATAERVFERLGFKNTSIGDIALELRVPASDIYRSYRSKSEIIEAVGRKLLRETESALDLVVKRRGPPKEKLRAAIRAVKNSHASRFASSPRLHALLKKAFDERWPIVDQHVQVLEKSLAEIIQQGKDDGAFRVEDVELAAMLVRSACMRFCDPRLIVGCVQDMRPTLDQIVDFCIVGLA